MTEPMQFAAMPWDGADIRRVLEFMAPLDQLPNPEGYVQPGVGYVPGLGLLDVPTPSGVEPASPGDWLVKVADGVFYPCKPDLFAEVSSV